MWKKYTTKQLHVKVNQMSASVEGGVSLKSSLGNHNHHSTG